MNFLQGWANIFSNQLRACKLLIKKPVSEHEFSPEVKILFKLLVKLFLTFIFYNLRIKKLLRNTNKSRTLILFPETIKVLVWIIVHTLGDSWNQPDKCFFCAMNQLNKSKVIFINAWLNSYPLISLNSRLRYNLTSLHDISHLIDRNHGDWFLVDSTQSLNYFFNMLRLKSFAINNAWTKTRMENINNIQRISWVQVMN